MQYTDDQALGAASIVSYDVKSDRYSYAAVCKYVPSLTNIRCFGSAAIYIALCAGGQAVSAEEWCVA